MFKRTSYLLVILGFLGLLVSVVLTPKSIMAEVVVEDMVYIPAGEFIMGSPSGEGNSDEYLQHKVYLDAFYIDKYEVTNEDYARFLNEKGNQEEEGALWLDIDSWACSIEKREGRYQSKSGYERYPVVRVTWYGARAYAKWRGCRLPTEAEWEKAARGGLVGKKYPWGNKGPDGSQCNFADKNLNSSWCDKVADDGYGSTAPVGSYPPNGYGLYDMVGNVYEWVNDWYDENYYQKGRLYNPQGPDTGSFPVIRGGSWFNTAWNLRCASRYYCAPDFAMNIFGFRCAKSS